MQEDMDREALPQRIAGAIHGAKREFMPKEIHAAKPQFIAHQRSFLIPNS